MLLKQTETKKLPGKCFKTHYCPLLIQLVPTQHLPESQRRKQIPVRPTKMFFGLQAHRGNM